MLKRHIILHTITDFIFQVVEKLKADRDLK